MMKRVGVTRLTTGVSEDQPPLIIATGAQIQQQSSVAGVSVHAQQTSVGLHESPTPHQTTIIVSTQQVMNYSKGATGSGGALQYAGAQYAGPPSKPLSQPGHLQTQHPRHKGAVGSQSPSTQLQVAVGQIIPGNATVGPPGTVPGIGASFQRLKVEDALSYLDQVKHKFNNQPQVYNDFLDIMKEFKSQSIDTPGVIQRVSNLFKGHPELIVGFNTFLPPGYKIEVQPGDQGCSYQVSVSMPSPNSCFLQHQQAAHNNMTHPSVVLGSQAASLLVSSTQSVQSTQQHLPQQHLVQIIPGTGSSAIVHNISTNSGSVGATAAIGATVIPPVIPNNNLHHISQAHQQLETPAPPPPNSSSQPVEFNHAIEYVNKIKNRFNRQPEKYKRFLEILHAYQRGQKELKEPQVKQQTEQEVYAQVAKLFENQDDLLVEFGQFLPDATGGGGIGGAAVKATAALDASRAADQQRPRTTIHSSAQRNIESVLMESDVPIYHSTNVGVRVPSPSYTMTSPTQSSVQQSIPSALRQDRDLPPHNLQSSQLTNQHSSQVSHHNKHSTPSHHMSSGLTSSSHQLKRSPSFSSSNPIGNIGGPPPAKKHKLLAVRDVSYAEASKFGSLNELGFFDRVKRALKSQEVYDNFLRCLLLFINEIISRSELVAVTAPFFTRHPELHRWLQEFLGLTPGGAGGSPPAAITASPPPAITPSHASIGNGPHHRENNPLHPPHSFSILAPPSGYTSIYSSGGERYTGENNTLGSTGAQLRQDRPQGDAAMEIDLTTCRRLGTSYCALPKGSADSPSRRCSGRTPLCRDVLNETWVSFPTWAEDSTFVTSRKTQFEEYIYRCEDERFELDVVIETNASTILALEGVHKKLCRMSPEDASRFRLDDCLGGSSPTIHQRALRRIYGEKANDIIAGLKKNPLVAVPVVLRRLKAKEEEWREAQKGFNKQWRELNEKYYLKSLDYQGVNFKQNDLKALRSKSLFNDIETIYEERREQIQSTVGAACGRAAPLATSTGPHLMTHCGPGGAALLTDAADLLIHHVRRQTAIQKQEKQKVKQLLRQFLPDLFQHPRQPLSDDERDDDDKELDVALDSPTSDNDDSKTAIGMDSADIENKAKSVKQEKDSSESDTNTPSAEKSTTKPASRLSKDDKNKDKENKENHKINTRNNSGDSESKGRKREGSNDSTAARIKSEPIDLQMVAETANSLPSSFDMKGLEWNESRDKNIKPVLFFGSGHWYVFLRLHAVLCQRLAAMKALAVKLAKDEAGDQRLRRPATAVALKLKPDNTLPVSQYYTALLEMIRSVLDGNMEASTYEDNLRDMFGVNAYIAFTLDKVVSYAVRQLQQCVQERTATKCVELHLQERSRSNSTSSNGMYQRRTQKLLRDEHAFKILIYGSEECRITFELLESGGGVGMSSNSNGGGSGSDQPTNQNAGDDSPTAPPAPPARLTEWVRYQENYANPAVMDTELPDGIFKDGVWCGRKAIYLQRNVRRSQKRHANNGRLLVHKESNVIVPVAAVPSEATSQLRPASHSSDDDENDDSEAVANKRKRKLDQSKEPKKKLTIDSNKDWNPVNPNSMGVFVNDDKTEVMFDNNKPNSKFTYVHSKEQFMCKKEALKRAWKCHKSVSQRKEVRWRSWLGGWSGRHVTTSQSRATTDWLRRGTRVLSKGGPDAPPYGPYSLYQLASTSPHAPDR